MSSKGTKSSLPMPLPPPPRGTYSPSPRSPSKRSISGGSTGSIPVGALPPPPSMKSTQQLQQQQSSFANNIAKSMTIEEMRQLHHRALRDAEAKRTELRLVLASRYRELVGSSEEVTKMRERAQELHELVHALPKLMDKVVKSTTKNQPPVEEVQKEEQQVDDDQKQNEDNLQNKKEQEKAQKVNIEIQALRRDLSILPRLIHRALDERDVQQAATFLIQLLTKIAEYTTDYPLATSISKNVKPRTDIQLDALAKAQMRMVFMHVQTLPKRITQLSTEILHGAASYGPNIKNPALGASTSAAALVTMGMLEGGREEGTAPNRPQQLLDMYYNGKAKLMQSLLTKLTIGNVKGKEDPSAGVGAKEAEDILSKIVLILQYDIILHPYQIFVLRKVPNDQGSNLSLPVLDPVVVQAKCSHFLAAHLPLIRTKVKSILVNIAGTTASALGQIRQSLYDKTDGVECMERLDQSGVCTWHDAVQGMVDIKTIATIGGGSSDIVAEADGSFGKESTSTRKHAFSLWSVLFSNTFSSLVHSLLTTAFQSVHAKVVSTLRLSLAHAPPLSVLLPHEAYRNTLSIASQLNSALLKVSDDAHELLVHAEERVESERRLRQSLYVQTCEIMGRLISELRRMVESSNKKDAVLELIVGRLCHLLKFRLTALPTLLHPDASPAALQGGSMMISLLELQSAFDLADDNEDGLITLDEALEAVDSAFAGTHVAGADMVRETLLLTTTATSDSKTTESGSNPLNVPKNVTLNELVLLSARGLRHDPSGRNSALGTIQSSLDDLIKICVDRWAGTALSHAETSLQNQYREQYRIVSGITEEEYQTIYASQYSPSHKDPSKPIVGNVSPHVVGYLLEACSVLNGSICPSDCILPVPSSDYGSTLGLVDGSDNIPNMRDTMRWALLRQAFTSVILELQTKVLTTDDNTEEENTRISIDSIVPSGLLALKNDLAFVDMMFYERNNHGFGGHDPIPVKQSMDQLEEATNTLLSKKCDATTLSSLDSELKSKQYQAMKVCHLFFSSLFGEDQTTADAGDLVGGHSATAAAASAAAIPFMQTPVASSCRFALLPIQSDKSATEVQLRKYKGGKDETESRPDKSAGSVIGSGLGFFSSMLKKK